MKREYIVTRKLELSHHVMAYSKKQAIEEAKHMGEAYADIYYLTDWRAKLKYYLDKLANRY